MLKVYQVLQLCLHIQNNCVSINTIVHPIRDASKSRNGYVHPMIPFLIATSFTCSDANILIDKMNGYNVEEDVRLEMIQVIKEETKECWDAND